MHWNHHRTETPLYAWCGTWLSTMSTTHNICLHPINFYCFETSRLTLIVLQLCERAYHSYTVHRMCVNDFLIGFVFVFVCVVWCLKTPPCLNLFNERVREMGKLHLNIGKCYWLHKTISERFHFDLRASNWIVFFCSWHRTTTKNRGLIENWLRKRNIRESLVRFQVHVLRCHSDFSRISH